MPSAQAEGIFLSESKNCQIAKCENQQVNKGIPKGSPRTIREVLGDSLLTFSPTRKYDKHAFIFVFLLTA